MFLTNGLAASGIKNDRRIKDCDYSITYYSNIEDKRAIGKQMLFFWHKAAEDLLEKRDLIPKNQIIDIHFNDLIDDPLKVSETRACCGVRREGRCDRSATSR